jgi:hypothetical protein
LRGAAAFAGAPALAVALTLAAAPIGASEGAIAAARADPKPPATATAAAAPSADVMARIVAAPWPARQLASGRFREYVPPLAGHAREQDRYGTAMLGYGLLQLGVRHRDRREIASGLRALARASKRPIQGGTREVFDDFALASAYNVARASLSGNRRFEAVAHPWRERLRHVRVLVLDRPRSFYNFQMVEAIEILELLRTGLHSKDRASVLARPERARRLVLNLLFRRFPEVAGSESTLGPNGPMALLGDPPYEPLAYHAFSLGLAARVVALLGAHAPAPMRNALAQGALASAALVGPDGDLAYAGRSQEQAWALAMTAFGERVAGGLAGTAPQVVAQDRALADEALARLGELHLGGPYGLSLTPGLHLDPGQTRAAMDPYVAGVAYTGLTLVALEWASTAPHRGTTRAAPAGLGVWLLGQGPGRMAVARTATEWFAVRLAPAEPTATSNFAGDLRYDAGLVALKRRGAAGRWHDLIPLRARTSTPWDSAGPLLTVAGQVGRPVGHDLVLAPDGGVDLVGEFRQQSGAVLRAGELMRVEPVDCGVQVLIPAQGGDGIEYSLFFRGTPTTTGPASPTTASPTGTSPTGTSRTSASPASPTSPGPPAPSPPAGPIVTSLVDGPEAVSLSLPAAVTLTPGYSSGANPELVRAQLRFAPAANQTIALTICER